jgi:hypothetical protein
VFSDEDLERLRSFPEINREELIRFFTLTAADVEFIDPRRGRGPSERLGLAVQLCTLPWLGFVPDDVASAPAAAIARLSERLQVPMSELRLYGGQVQDPDRPFEVGGPLSRVASGEFVGARGARRVPAGSSDGA